MAESTTDTKRISYTEGRMIRPDGTISEDWAPRCHGHEDVEEALACTDGMRLAAKGGTPPHMRDNPLAAVNVRAFQQFAKELQARGFIVELRTVTYVTTVEIIEAGAKLEIVL